MSFLDGGITKNYNRPLSMVDSFNNIHQTQMPFSEFSSQKSLPRTNSEEFKRTISSDLSLPTAMTHRRTQSYDTRHVRIVTNGNPVFRNGSKVSRQSSTRSIMNTRESYAAPVYQPTGQAFVNRNISMYRKGIIEEAIQ